LIKTGTTCDDRVTIVSRAEWGARPPRATVNITVPVNMTFIHHSDRPWRGTNLTQCIKQVQSIQDFHMDFRGQVSCSRRSWTKSPLLKPIQSVYSLVPSPTQSATCMHVRYWKWSDQI